MCSSLVTTIVQASSISWRRQTNADMNEPEPELSPSSKPFLAAKISSLSRCLDCSVGKCFGKGAHLLLFQPSTFSAFHAKTYVHNDEPTHVIVPHRYLFLLDEVQCKLMDFGYCFATNLVGLKTVKGFATYGPTLKTINHDIRWHRM